MIRAEFYKSEGLLNRFNITGHAGYADHGSDVVCAAVSSAVQLIVNILEEFDCEPSVTVEDDLIDCRITALAQTGSALLEQLVLHLRSVCEEFPKTIKITISEV